MQQGNGFTPQQRQVVLVGAGRAHLGVLRMWGLRRLREAAAEEKNRPSRQPSTTAAETDATAAALLRSLLGTEAIPTDAAANGGQETETAAADTTPNASYIPASAVSLLLVTETTEVIYSAMVPGYISGEFPLSDLIIDLAPLCSFAGASLIIARAVGLLPQQKLLLLDGSRPPLRFDVLSIDTGSKPEMPLIPGSLRPLTRQHTFIQRGSADGELSTAVTAEGTNMSAEGCLDSTPSLSGCSPCGCWKAPAGGSRSSRSSKYCCCCVCPMRPLQGIVARWLLLRQQLQRAWQQFQFSIDNMTTATTTAEEEGGDKINTTPPPQNNPTLLGNTPSLLPAFRILVIGGGAVGVEMALALQYAVQQYVLSLEQQHPKPAAENHQEQQPPQQPPSVSNTLTFKTEVVLATSGPEILTGYSQRAQAMLRKLLVNRGVKVVANCRVLRVEETADGRWRAVSVGPHLEDCSFDCTFCCTSAGPQDWIRSTRLPLDDDGFLKVLPTLQCVDFPWIFAAGDTASITGHSRPKAGVYAVRAAPVIEGNIWRLLRGEPLEAWRPQSSFLSLLATGKREAALCRGGFVFHGYWPWKLKKAIDSSWLSGHRDFPDASGRCLREIPSPPSFLGLKELGAAAASGAEALSTWVSANLASFEGERHLQTDEEPPHPCLEVFVRLLKAAATSKCRGSPRCAGCSGKMPQRSLSEALRSLKYHTFQLQQLHEREEQLQLQQQQQPHHEHHPPLLSNNSSKRMLNGSNVISPSSLAQRSFVA